MIASSTIKKSALSSTTIGGKPQRVVSIDILRALTMVLMIFVNDLGSLHNIPLWLEHVAPGVDGIGLADTVFPAFLFIVGLSLPFALDNRRKRGDSQMQLLIHILTRSFALLVMGVFFVNGETLNANAMGLPRFLYNFFCCVCYILIWNYYPKTWNKALVRSLKGIGIAALIILAILYRGGPDDNINRFTPQWWGILGLIGWSYLAAAVITLLARNRFSVILGGWIFFAVLSMASKAHLVPPIIHVIPQAISGGTLAGLTMGGVLTSMIFRHYRKHQDNKGLTLILLGFSTLLVVLSIITRPYWRLAKLGATPAWLFLCSAFTILAFLLIYWVADVGRKANWFNFIKPAGTDTLLCYLMPYILGTTLRLIHFHWPQVILNGGIGLLKSLFIALFCVLLTRSFNRAGVRLKL